MWLLNPKIDRIVGIVAVLPFIYPLYRQLTSPALTLPRLAAICSYVVLVSTMVTRRPPVRVTTNPWYWILTFVASYGLLVPALLPIPGVRLAPIVLTNTLAVLGVAVMLYGRFSLGRNIGLLPAQRRLALGGAYRFVRHPIYTGNFVIFASLILAALSPWTVLVVGILTGLFMLKSVVEERFLQGDPAYAAYMQRVRWRWFPWIA